MLTIGEFSKICRVSAKTLRYYAEIELIAPAEINRDNGYRYYSLDQLDTMLWINRLKSYQLSLDEIRAILEAKASQDELLHLALIRKKMDMTKQAQALAKTLNQLNEDIASLQQGKSIMSYLENMDVTLVEVPVMRLLSTRKMVCEDDFADAYGCSFGELFKKMAAGNLTLLAPPMVLFHNAEFSPAGLDTEFAVPVKEHAAGTREFQPGLCLKTILYGSYVNLPSVYAKQRKWAEKEGYASSNALYEVYVTDPSQVSRESELITEIYYPVRLKESIR